ncbi:hypothetical protein M422DRAFT_55923 [Sphaerobolus stellatus SS14]|uniref:Aldehyde dehydrogenase domain-containing protein n=1 Tax=Sphaerobolus stellatus (strain SS14) TaxID=990650 RepID=A0A0C9T917_SPHS4|nr:hypothetical protein M422DRAFT_55923 [Sphaerobolus stellatus SS14]
MKVSSNEEAIELMNDSPYGLTASIWTSLNSEKKFHELATELETGTVLLNRFNIFRCDAVDSSLAWTGVKNSGRGVSCSELGYDQLTRPRSICVKVCEGSERKKTYGEGGDYE